MQKVHGKDCIRFCPSCGKNVYDLSGLTRDEAMGLIAAREGNVCLRLHRRADGTVITSDCPVGKSARIKRKGLSQMLLAVVGFATASLAAGNMLFHRFAHKAATLAPPPAERVVERVKPAPLPEIPVSTPLPIQEHPSEGVIITNERIESSSTPLPDDSSITVTMGAVCPPPPVAPTAQPIVTLPSPNSFS